MTLFFVSMQNSDGSYRFQVLKRIEHILMFHSLREVMSRLARQAVNYDNNKLYPEALTLYGVCCTLLHAEITVSVIILVQNRHGALVVTRLLN